VSSYDVAVIGAGVVGAAIARELSRHELKVALIEGGSDVGAGTSKANTAILHTGFDATPGTLEARLVHRGYELLGEYAGDSGIALERTGALMVAWTAEERDALPLLIKKARDNGVTDVTPLTARELYAAEPHLGPGALGGLRIPGESIIDPFSPPLAFATEAVENGVTLMLDSPVTAAFRADDLHALRAGGAVVRTRWVINAAGLRSDEIDFMFGHQRFTVKPRRGELIVFDKLARGRIGHILLPVPSATTKGVLVSPTVFGNVLLGPTAEDLDDKRATATSAGGIDGLLAHGRRILPSLLDEEVTATYAGLRAATEHGDYQIHCDQKQRYLCVGGIRSTGLSASLAIAEHVVQLLTGAGLQLEPRGTFFSPFMPFLGEVGERPYQQAEQIATDPDFGRIVCHCERVTKGELLRAAHAAIPARCLDGLRRRTRCLQGRCQGFNCLAEVTRLLADETGQSMESLLGIEDGK
jgi:glycerol-3-phosphate dehydrogenase